MEPFKISPLVLFGDLIKGVRLRFSALYALDPLR